MRKTVQAKVEAVRDRSDSKEGFGVRLQVGDTVLLRDHPLGRTKTSDKFQSDPHVVTCIPGPNCSYFVVRNQHSQRERVVTSSEMKKVPPELRDYIDSAPEVVPAPAPAEVPERPRYQYLIGDSNFPAPFSPSAPEHDEDVPSCIVPSPSDSDSTEIRRSQRQRSQPLRFQCRSISVETQTFDRQSLFNVNTGWQILGRLLPILFFTFFMYF